MSSLGNSKSSKASTRSYHSTSGSNHNNGSMDNEFLQFYSDLYESAVLYSDYNFQQRVLYPGREPLPKPTGNTHRQHQSCQYSHLPRDISVSPSKPTKQPHSSTKVRGGKKNHPPPPLTTIATSSVRRKVSFSKHSPRLNLITPTPPSTSLSPGTPLPKITLEEGMMSSSCCWSSDLEDSGSTETEQATSDKDTDISDFKQARVKLGRDKTSTPDPLISRDDDENETGGTAVLYTKIESQIDLETANVDVGNCDLKNELGEGNAVEDFGTTEVDNDDIDKTDLAENQSFA